MRGTHATRRSIALILVLLPAGCGKAPESPPPPEPPVAARAAGPPPEAALRELSLGVCQLEQFRYQDAIAHFRSALDLHPGWLAAEVDLAIAHLNDLLDEGHAEAAIEAADRALGLAPQDERARYVKAYALSEQLRRFDEALPILRQLVEDVPEDPHAWYQLARTALEGAESSGDEAALVVEAEAAFRRALELDPRFSEANYKLARLLVDSEDEDRLAEGMTLLEGHQELMKGRPPVQQNYLTRGEFAQAWPFLPSRPALDPRPVRFTAGAALDVPPFRGVEPYPGLSPSRYRHGLTVADLDGDGRLDIATARREVEQPAALLWPAMGFRAFAPPFALGLQGSACSVAVAADFDRDGDLDLFLTCNSGNALLLNDGAGLFADATVAAGLGSWQHAAWTASAVDFDHDGDLDLHVLSPPGGDRVPPVSTQWLFRNDGSARFTLVEDRMGLPETLASNDLLWSDIDGDNAVDLLAVGEDGPTLFRNDRSGRFQTLPLSRFVPELAQAAAPTVRWALFDAEGDEDLDIALVAAAGGPQQLIVMENRSRPGQPDLRAVWAAKAPSGTASLRALDLDLDGHVELVALGSTDWPSGEIRHVGDLGLESGLQPLLVRLVSHERLDPKHAVAADLDGDGDLDLVVLEAPTGRPFVLWNELEPGAGWVQIAALGRAERSNPQGFGAKSTVASGSLRQYREHHAGPGFMSQVVAPEVFGLGRREAVDVLALLWPSGIRQAECLPGSGQTIRVMEIDRQPSSCPMLYAWSGTEWSFQSDCFDTAPVGLLVAPGVHVAGDPEGWYRLRDGAVALVDGVVNLLVAEFLNESLLADRAALLAVDLPAGRRLIVHEAVRFGAPAPERVLFSVGPGEPARAARLDGRDLGTLLDEEDRRVAGWSQPTGYLGLAEPHELVLELDESAGLLVLTGSLNFPNSTNLFAASQRGLRPEPLSLELLEPGGAWRALSADVGVPAGFHEDVVLDLRAFDLSGPSTLRLRTNLQVSWDRVAFYREVTPVPVDQALVVPMIRAEKRWLGIPREIQGPENRWREFPLDGLVGRSDWVRQAGAVTPDGDVRDLLAEVDGELAIVRPGEAIELGFDTTALPSPPPGGSRFFVLSTHGWVKDADPHTAHSDSVEPFPIPGRAVYP